MRKEQYRALSQKERAAYLASKKYDMGEYYFRTLKPRRELQRLERQAKALLDEPTKEQKLAKIREQIAEIKTKMEGKP